MDFASPDNQYLVKPILFGLGLVANLVLNLGTNREVLFKKNEKNYLYYFILWLISVLFTIVVLIFPESNGYTSLFYVALGFSLPQLAISNLLNKELTTANNKLTKAMDSAYIGLAVRDQIRYQEMRKKCSYEVVKKEVEDEMNRQVNMGTFSPEKGQIYLNSMIGFIEK
jgi:hypothetical protein